MENKIGKSFDNLAQRMVYSYGATFPEFVPVVSEEASEASQRDLYGFLKELVARLYDDPTLLSLPSREDDSYGDWELQKKKPKLIVEMKAIQKKINEFYLLLMQLGRFGTVCGDSLHVDKAYLKLYGGMVKKLDRLGLSCEDAGEKSVFRCEAHPGLFPAWKLLVRGADKQANPVIFFSRGMFDPGYSYPSAIFASIAGEKQAFEALQSFFVQNGYKRVDCRENQVSLDWVRNYGKKEEPLKGSWAEREHGGLSVWFDYSRRNQVFFGLRVPRYKEVLGHFDGMEDRLKEFVISKTKQCNNCGYCTQTDKTGTRKMQYTTVSYKGEYNLCQLYPGFTYVWTRIDENTANNIMAFLSFIDRLFAKEAAAK